jgi:hypothetical protein
MDLQSVALSVEEVVDVAASLLHEPAVDLLSSDPPIGLARFRRRPQMDERLLELLNQQIPRITMFAPPDVFYLELPPSLLKENDFHTWLDTG